MASIKMSIQTYTSEFSDTKFYDVRMTNDDASESLVFYCHSQADAEAFIEGVKILIDQHTVNVVEED